MISTVIFSVDALNTLANDPQAGSKIAQAIQNSMFGGKKTVEYDGVTTVEVVHTQAPDDLRLFAVGGGKGRHLGKCGELKDIEPGRERQLFEAALKHYDLGVRAVAEHYGPKKKDAEPSAPTASAAS